MIRRSLEALLRSDLDEKIVLLSGPRQCGKTFLSRQLFAGTHVYLNLDSAADRKVLRETSWDRRGRTGNAGSSGRPARRTRRNADLLLFAGSRPGGLAPNGQALDRDSRSALRRVSGHPLFPQPRPQPAQRAQVLLLRYGPREGRPRRAIREPRGLPPAQARNGKPEWLIETQWSDGDFAPALAFYQRQIAPVRALQLVRECSREKTLPDLELRGAAGWLAGLET